MIGVLDDGMRSGFKIYRDHSPDVDNDQKGTKQGYLIDSLDADSAGGNPVVSLPGVEDGWGHWAAASGQRHGIGSWGQAIPAILRDSDGALVPIGSKSLTVDSDYAVKTAGSGNDSTKFGIADAATPTGTPGILVQCLTHESHEQIFFPIASGTSAIYAKIRWNYSTESDLSEGELMNYDVDTDTFSASGTLIWVDYQKGKQVQVWTAGDQTIFETKLLKGDVTRQNQTRDLYRVISVVKDGGYRITHLETLSKDSLGVIRGNLVSTQLQATPWASISTSRIKTTLLTVEKENIVWVNVPAEWYTQGTEDYKYLEAHDFSRGKNWWFRPISPVCTSPTEKTYESEYQTNSTTIATYRKV